jgi:phosphatidylglycerophosphate synthase
MNIKNQFAQILSRIGMTADGLTIFGLVFAFYTGIFIYLGVFMWACVCLALSGLCDLLDGAVARVSGKVSVFGGILDSSLDRYGDAFVLGGCVFFFARQSQNLYTILAFSALMGSFAISYIRARAECEIEHCRTGFWERGERLVYLGVGLFLNNLTLVVTVLGVATHWTALQRLLYSQNKNKFSRLFSSGRRNPRYYFKVAALLLAASLFKLN